MYISTLLFLSAIFALLSVIGIVVGLTLLFVKDESFTIFHRLSGVVLLFVSVTGNIALCKLRDADNNEPFQPYKIEYSQILKNGNIKYYIYNDKVYNIESYVDDKNFKVRNLFYKDRVVLGIIHSPNHYNIVQYVPIDEKEIMEENTVDKK